MLNEYLNIIDYKKCTGCAACKNICPVGAIQMQEDEEGFLFPVINENVCINCGLCKNSCPILNAQFNETPEFCYAVAANDEIRMQSSSGGLFTVLAENIINHGGYVCGAAFDNEWNVKHIIVDNLNDLKKLRGSKYVQSNLGNSYLKIKDLLENNKTVLFTGTPCQAAGLKSFLKKSYENLYIVDIVCHGVPSPKVWQKYLNENFSNIYGLNFRDKELGWNCKNLVVNTGNDKIVDSKFMDGFIDNLYLRKSCSECSYTKLERVSDLTIADFWGLEILKPEFYNRYGLSLAIPNTQKGIGIFNKISDKLNFKEELGIEYTKYNYPLYTSSKENVFRSKFFEQLDKKGFNEAFKNSYNYIGILNFWWCNNYGAMCTAYALQEVIKNLGYAVKTINWVPKWFYDSNFLGGISETFAKKYFNLTELCHTKKDLRKLNNRIDKFIVGSDQVWRYGVEQLMNWAEFKDSDNICFLAFADYAKPKISYSASFATDKYEGSVRNKQLVKWALNRFQGISVREDTGVDICKNEFGIEAVHTLDPVFLVDKKCWEDIIATSNITEKDYICYYVLDNLYEKQDLLANLQNKTGKKCIDISKDFKTKLEDWLYYIKNCELFIADSFHGCCLAIIFNKPFICIKNPLRGKDRFESLFRMLHLENRFINFDEDILERTDLFDNIDWEAVNNILKDKKLYSLNWLEEQLKKSVVHELNSQEAFCEAIANLQDDLFEALNDKISINQLRYELNLIYTELNKKVDYQVFEKSRI